MKKNRVYLGIVGQIAAGKGEVVKILKEQYGFVSFNLSSILHKILEEQGAKNFTRADLQDLGDKLRKEEGEGVLAKRAVKQLNRLNQHRNMVIEGIRNPAEVNYLRTLPNFILVAVKARKAIRFKRLKKRAKPWDPKTWQDFLVIDRRDKGLGQKKYGQQVGRCVKMADLSVENNGSLNELGQRVKETLFSHPRAPKRIILQV